MATKAKHGARSFAGRARRGRAEPTSWENALDVPLGRRVRSRSLDRTGEVTRHCGCRYYVRVRFDDTGAEEKTPAQDLEGV